MTASGIISETESDLFPFQLVNLHVSRMHAGWRYQLHELPVYEVYTLLTGQVEFSFPGGPLLLHPGNSLLIPPGVRRSLHATAPAGLSLVFSFSVHDANFKMPLTHFPLSPTVQLGAESLAATLESAPEVQPLQLIRVNALLLELLGTKRFSRHCAQWISRWSETENQVRRTVEYAESLMRANMTPPLSLEELARLAAVSRAGLERAFREIRGISAIRRSREIRLEKALALLRNGCSIADAARKTGFVTTQHFATVFRRQFHQSPSEIDPI